MKCAVRILEGGIDAGVRGKQMWDCAKAAERGNTTRAKMVQRSHVFSHAQRFVNFIGTVKFPFTTPATISGMSPRVVLPMLLVSDEAG